MASPEIEFERAVAAFRARKFGQARKIIRKLERQVGPQPPFIHLIGFIELESGDTARAVEALSQASTAFPNDANVFNGLGIAHRRLGDFATARRAFENALRIDSTQGAFFRNLGNLLSQAGEVEAAINAYCQALERDPDDGAVVRALSNDLERSGDRTAALGVLEDFLERQPDDLKTLTHLGSFQIRVMNLSAAEDAYARALQAVPGNDIAVAGLMSVRTLRGDVEGALETARSAGLADRASPASGSAYVFAMNYEPTATPLDIRKAAEAICHIPAGSMAVF